MKRRDFDEATVFSHPKGPSGEISQWLMLKNFPEVFQAQNSVCTR
jgi:hypothetical protein